MPRKPRAKFRALVEELARVHPELDDPAGSIADGDVLVDGIARTNPATLVRIGAAITLRKRRPLRGEAKLRAAFDAFDISADGRIAVDIGAAAGGFTRVLLERGVRKVYAVDAGHGQLRGFLRQDSRVVNLEATNLGDLNASHVPDTVELVTIDLSYLALHAAVPQLERLRLARDAEAIALVKPQFELSVARPPRGRRDLEAAVVRASDGFGRFGWRVARVIQSPVRGERGSTEFFLHARRGR